MTLLTQKSCCSWSCLSEISSNGIVQLATNTSDGSAWWNIVMPNVLAFSTSCIKVSSHFGSFVCFFVVDLSVYLFSFDKWIDSYFYAKSRRKEEISTHVHVYKKEEHRTKIITYKTSDLKETTWHLHFQYRRYRNIRSWWSNIFGGKLCPKVLSIRVTITSVLQAPKGTLSLLLWLPLIFLALRRKVFEI